MSDIAIKNNMGREYSIPFVVDSQGLLTENVVLKKGLNLLKSEVWDKIKNHPAIKCLSDTEIKSRFLRIQQIAGSKDATYVTTKEILDGTKKIEVTDYRKLNKKD